MCGRSERIVSSATFSTLRRNLSLKESSVGGRSPHSTARYLGGPADPHGWRPGHRRDRLLSRTAIDSALLRDRNRSRLHFGLHQSILVCDIAAAGASRYLPHASRDRPALSFRFAINRHSRRPQRRSEH